MKLYAVIHVIPEAGDSWVEIEGYRDTKCEFFMDHKLASKHAMQLLQSFEQDDMVLRIYHPRDDLWYGFIETEEHSYWDDADARWKPGLDPDLADPLDNVGPPVCTVTIITLDEPYTSHRPSSTEHVTQEQICRFGKGVRSLSQWLVWDGGDYGGLHAPNWWLPVPHLVVVNDGVVEYERPTLHRNIDVSDWDVSELQRLTEAMNLSAEQVLACPVIYFPLTLDLIARVAQDVQDLNGFDIAPDGQTLQPRHPTCDLAYQMDKLTDFIHCVCNGDHAHINLHEYIVHAFRVPKPWELEN